MRWGLSFGVKAFVCRLAGRMKGIWFPTRKRTEASFPAPWLCGLPWGHSARGSTDIVKSSQPRGWPQFQMFSGISSIKAYVDEFQWDKLWGTKEKPPRHWVCGGNFLLSCCRFLLSFFFSLPFASFFFIKSRCYVNAPVKYYMHTSEFLPSPVYQEDPFWALFLLSHFLKSSFFHPPILCRFFFFFIKMGL